MKDMDKMKKRFTLYYYGTEIDPEDFERYFTETDEEVCVTFQTDDFDGESKKGKVYRTSIKAYKDVRFVKFDRNFFYIDEDLRVVEKATGESHPTAMWFMNIYAPRKMITATKEFEKLVQAQQYCPTIKVREKTTGKEGVARTCEGGVRVSYDTDDEKVVTSKEFNRDFEIKAVIRCYLPIKIRKKATGKEGAATTFKGGARVFYGAEDGSDDKTISSKEFKRDFEVTGLILR